MSTALRIHFLVGERAQTLAPLGSPGSSGPAAASEDSAISGTGPEGGHSPLEPPPAAGTGWVGKNSHGSTSAWLLDAASSPAPYQPMAKGRRKKEFSARLSLLNVMEAKTWLSSGCNEGALVFIPVQPDQCLVQRASPIYLSREPTVTPQDLNVKLNSPEAERAWI